MVQQIQDPAESSVVPCDCSHVRRLDLCYLFAQSRRIELFRQSGEAVCPVIKRTAVVQCAQVLDAQGLAAFTFKLDPREFTATMGAPIGLFHRWIGLIHDRGVFSAS